jgi:hypothetical protein
MAIDRLITLDQNKMANVAQYRSTYFSPRIAFYPIWWNGALWYFLDGIWLSRLGR